MEARLTCQYPREIAIKSGGSHSSRPSAALFAPQDVVGVTPPIAFQARFLHRVDSLLKNMKLLTLARSFFHRKRHENLSLRADKIQNEYADYHQYSSVDYGDYSSVESTSTYGALPCQNATLAPDSIKHLVLIHRSDGRLKFKASCENGEIRDIINTSHYSPFLCGSMVDYVEVTGVINDSFLLWLSAAKIIISLRIRDAKIICSPAVFYKAMYRISLQSLSICRCLFVDAQMLSDELFFRNPQIREFEISSIDGCRQSFPLLTDRVLRGWCVTGLPRKLLLHHVETSFTVRGIRTMIEAALQCRHSRSWSFGKICSTTDQSIEELEACKARFGDQLQILRIHRSYIHVISDLIPRMYVFFYTSYEKTTNEDGLESLDFK